MKRRTGPDEPHTAAVDTIVAREDAEAQALRERCMGRCLDELPAAKRDFIVRYRASRESRKALIAEILETEDVEVGTIYVRACRIRAGLRKCFARCVQASQDSPEGPEGGA